jgi:hypothetical protein
MNDIPHALEFYTLFMSRFPLKYMENLRVLSASLILLRIAMRSRMHTHTASPAVLGHYKQSCDS